jgi:hypothetical protein
MRRLVIASFLIFCAAVTALPQSPAQNYKTQLIKDVDAMAKQTQVMVDMVFSFANWVFRNSRLRNI